MMKRPSSEELIKKLVSSRKALDAEYEFFCLFVESLSQEPENDDQIIRWALDRLGKVLKADLLFWVEKHHKQHEVQGMFWKEKDINKQLALSNLLQKNRIPGVAALFGGHKTEEGNDKLFIPQPLEMEFQFAIMLPVKIKEVAYGVIAAAWKKENAVLPNDQSRYKRILNVFAMLLANIMANEERNEPVLHFAQKDLARITQKYDTLQVICSKVGTFTSPEGGVDAGKGSRKECLKMILEHCLKTFKAQMAAVWSVNEAGKWGLEVTFGDEKRLEKLAQAGWEKVIDNTINQTNTDTSEKKSLLTTVIKKGKARKFDRKDSRMKRWPEEQLFNEDSEKARIYSMVAAPIKVQGKVIGIIALCNRQKNQPFTGAVQVESFTMEQLELLNSIANPVSLLYKFYAHLHQRQGNSI